MSIRPGHLHVITGPMFAGKTLSLMAEIENLVLEGETVEIRTHAIDTRHRIGSIAAHSGEAAAARAFSSADDLLCDITPGSSVLAIDEAQFFGPGLMPVIEELVGSGRRVIISGLCVTFDGQPFEPLPALMAIAERVDKLVARCSICGSAAPYHQPLEGAALADPLTIRSEQVGGSNIYEPRCRLHFTNRPSAA